MALLTDVKSDTGYLVPPGSLFPFAGTVAPSGWLLCDGSSRSTTTYANLFSVLNYTYGGSGANFNLPDLRGRAIAGKDDMGGAAANRITNAASGITGTTLGSAGGSQTHTLTTTEIPAHSHTQDPHSHTFFDAVRPALLDAGAGSNRYSGSNQTFTFPSTTADTTATNQSTGGDQAHRNVQPTIILNYIIKT
jgi:microcystin-dependent protein